MEKNLDLVFKPVSHEEMVNAYLDALHEWDKETSKVQAPIVVSRHNSVVNEANKSKEIIR